MCVWECLRDTCRCTFEFVISFAGFAVFQGMADMASGGVGSDSSTSITQRLGFRECVIFSVCSIKYPPPVKFPTVPSWVHLSPDHKCIVCWHIYGIAQEDQRPVGCHPLTVQLCILVSLSRLSTPPVLPLWLQGQECTDMACTPPRYLTQP